MIHQLALPMADFDRALLASGRLRKIYRAAAESLGLKSLGEEWGCGETKVGLKLDEKDRHYLKPAEQVDLLLRRPDVIIAELCDIAGYETPERKRELLPAEKLGRLTATISASLGPDVAEMLFRKAGVLP